jgi:secreted trypsin-like serine protease
LILDQDNNFIGSCVVIPNDSRNDNNRGTAKVLTAAHKLNKVGRTDELKVRVGEYDATGFNAPETLEHIEYTVRRILKHPGFNPGRLDNDIAILYTDRNIDLGQSNINTACLPSCKTQFDYKFNNGTGTRCWVAGFGKDEFDGKFQVVQRKVDMPIIDDNSCNNDLKNALNAQRSGSGNRFNLSPSEICAGGEVGKDACTGDGGSPLVCQSKTGKWTVVGIVTWGVGCASDIPGVYARISHFVNWIDRN